MKNNLKISSFLSGKNSMKIILAIGFLGILLIVCSEYIKPSSAVESNKDGKDYSAVLENKISAVVSAITGEATPKVMLTLESGIQNVYATESKEKNSENSGQRAEKESEEKYIIVKNSQGNQEALIVTEIEPVIKGVVIVSKYAGNSIMKESIVNSVKTVLGIPSNKVCVVTKKG